MDLKAGKVETVVLDDLTFKIRRLEAEQGLPLFNRAAAILAGSLPAVEDLIEAGEGSEEKKEKFAAAAMKNFLSLFTRPDFSDHVMAFVKGFKPATVVVNGDKETALTDGAFNLIFAGRYPLVYRWIFECMKVNFGDDFLALFPVDVVAQGLKARLSS